MILSIRDPVRSKIAERVCVGNDCFRDFRSAVGPTCDHPSRYHNHNTMGDRDALKLTLERAYSLGESADTVLFIR